MLHSDCIQSKAAIGYTSEALLERCLPPTNTSRWVAKRKAEVVAAVNGGILTIAEACQRYDLTPEELVSWQRAVAREGVPGLRATRVQHYRQLHEREARLANPFIG